MNKVICFHQGAELYGSDKIFLLVVSELAKGNVVKVVLDSYGPLVELLKDAGVSDIEVLDLAVLRRSKIFGLRSGLLYLRSFVRAVFNIRRVIKRFEANIVYVNTLAVVAPLISMLPSNVKVIHHIHEIQHRPRIAMRLLYTISVLCSSTVLCVSKAVKRCVSEKSWIRLRDAKVLYNGIPMSFVSESEKSLLRSELALRFPDFKLPLVAYVARIHFWKGQLQFVETIRILRDEFGLSVNVAMFGDVYPGYEYLIDEIRSKIEEYNLSNNIQLFGFREDSSVLFSISEFSVMGSTEPDPLPTIVLESMQQGTPVVAYGHGGSCEMLENGKTGILVTPICARQMALRISELMRVHDIKVMGRNAKESFDEKFSHRSFIDRVSREFLFHG